MLLVQLGKRNMSFGKMIHLRLLLLSDEKKKKKERPSLLFGSDRGAASAIKPKRMEIGPGSLSPTIGPLINMKVFIAFSFFSFT